MISYYNSKHPGLFLYLLLVTASVCTFLFFDVNALHVGILSILWGCFIFLRTLSFYEINSAFTPYAAGASKSGNNSALPHDLTKRMQGKNNFKRGLFAMHAIHERTILWFVLAALYVGYHIYLLQNKMSSSVIIENLSVFFIIGAGFWAGQTYAYSDRASTILISVCSILLGLAFFTIMLQAPTPSPITLGSVIYYGNHATPLLAALITYSAVILLYSCIHGLNYSLNAFIGLMLISLLVICAFMFEPSSQNIALWIAGWSLFSIFWIRSYCHKSKNYTLYQCQ